MLHTVRVKIAQLELRAPISVRRSTPPTRNKSRHSTSVVSSRVQRGIFRSAGKGSFAPLGTTPILPRTDSSPRV
ncbi:MAG: hypothetical protein OJF58_003347 [Enhydrobacter sp.]|nr:MAG: hypothetical protein OJF58_003347 [Enhydrobacter sp.]